MDQRRLALIGAQFSPFENERSFQPLELEISRHIAYDGTNNRAKGFYSIMLQSAVSYDIGNVLREHIFNFCLIHLI